MRTAEDILQEWTSNLPQGSAWSRRSDGNLSKLLLARAQARALLETDIGYLSREISPLTAVLLQDDYEEVLDLPDYVGLISALSDQQRRMIDFLFWTTNGAASKQDFMDLAEKIGWTISITTFTPARFGQTCFGQPLYGVSWQYVWTVHVLSCTDDAVQFSVLRGKIEDECPAHTYVLFDTSKLVTDDAVAAPLGSFLLGINSLSQGDA
ncbi:putative phage tail protein [Gluconobacter morbifer]|uniref:Uncharacterized protein n=1 Tax=Gluconobacter morbifer G707 TaxID=1088869 RepID=G6XKW0_9PROT|nr:putative phage tail protein [Gluconobacter morbifer]EHH67555.1 hypothetical protein GMO_21260 [Gluconobacter morbifer G707]